MTWRGNLTAPPGRRNRVQDSRFLRTYPNAPRLSRGSISNIRPRVAQSSVVEDVHRFFFLTNPWEISTSYSVNNGIDLTDPATYSSAMADIPPMREGLISVSFSMLLDRTYEVWSGSLPEGVLHDMAQLERVLGVPDSTRRAAGGGGYDDIRLGRTVTRDSVGASRSINQFPGVIVKRPVRIRFGSPRAYAFDGFITDLSITMMKFNAEMVPTRAGINLSATTWGDSDAASLASTSRLTPEGLGGPLSGDQGTSRSSSPSSSSSNPSRGGTGGGGSVMR